MKKATLLTALFIVLGVVSRGEDAQGAAGCYENVATVIKKWRSTPYSVAPTLSGELIPYETKAIDYFCLRIQGKEVFFDFKGGSIHSESHFPIMVRDATSVSFNIVVNGSSESGRFERKTEFLLRKQADGDLRLSARSVLRRRSLFGSTSQEDTAEYRFRSLTTEASAPQGRKK